VTLEARDLTHDELVAKGVRAALDKTASVKSWSFGVTREVLAVGPVARVKQGFTNCLTGKSVAGLSSPACKNISVLS
jgi:hypothetical protein